MVPADLKIADAVEAAAWSDCLAAAPVALECSVLKVPGAEATLLRTAAVAVPMMNRIIGWPADTAPTDEALAWVRQAYLDADIDGCWIHAWDLPGGSPLSDGLAARGARADAGARWLKFLFDLEKSPPGARTDATLSVRPARADEAQLAGEIICRVFGLPPIMEPWLGSLVNRRNWRMFFACDADGNPVATGAMFIDGDRAWLGMGTTLPEARQRGAQQMLLAARLAAAKAAGCVVAAIETGVALDGAVNHSLNNIRRAGFDEVGLRINYLYQTG